MADRAQRVKLIERLQELRGRTTVISYVTSTRENLEAQMGMDCVPLVYRHLLAAKANAESKIDLFLHSNGGDGIVPWRLVSLIREFSSEFTVLVPNRAFSAATLTAMGADRVYVHPMGMLGPIDPTVVTPYNPPNPENPTQRLGISVEDVSSYISLVKDDVGIRHEEELVQAFNTLARKIHPLALGTVKRSTSQSRMLGEKLLKGRRVDPLDEHSITEIVDKLASKLYFHGHPIHRGEARDELKLPFVEDAPVEVADAMWELYEAYAADLQLEVPFNPFAEASGGTAQALPNPPQLFPNGNMVPTVPTVSQTSLGPYVGSIVESAQRSDRNMIQLDAVVVRDWNGEAKVNLSVWKVGWEQET
jgi:Serine dehydrogenase proteinase